MGIQPSKSAVKHKANAQIQEAGRGTVRCHQKPATAAGTPTSTGTANNGSKNESKNHQVWPQTFNPNWCTAKSKAHAPTNGTKGRREEGCVSTMCAKNFRTFNGGCLRPDSIDPIRPQSSRPSRPSPPQTPSPQLEWRAGFSCLHACAKGRWDSGEAWESQIWEVRVPKSSDGIRPAFVPLRESQIRKKGSWTDRLRSKRCIWGT